MDQKLIIGYIVGSTPLKQHIKSNGKSNEEVCLTIRQADEKAFPQLLSVKCTGWKTHYAPLAGSDQLVEVELGWRVYSCKDKEGRQTTNNDIFALNIKVIQ